MTDNRGEVAAAARAFADLVAHGQADLPRPGHGDTGTRFDALVAWGREDPVLARLAEGHVDALAILAELDRTDLTRPGRRWGVWAAVPNSVHADHCADGWRLTGDRPWCSGAGVCTDALVTAATDEGPRLFAVRVNDPSVSPMDGTWPAVGMAASDSRTVRFSGTPGQPVGGPGAYVDRPGFWFGAAGVAACWYGGALGVADALLAAARSRPLDPHALAHLGAVDAALTAGAAVVREAAQTIDERPGDAGALLARRVRAVIEWVVTEVLARVGRALGAAPLCLDAAYARRVADLTVYVRQSHAERDLAELGAQLADPARPAPW